MRRGTESIETEVGVRGGVLELGRVARLTIPEGAFEERTMLVARRTDVEGLPRTGRDFERVGQALEVTPHGLRLERPATVELAVEDDQVAADELRVLRLDDEEDTTWEPVREVRVVEAEERTGYRDVQRDEDSVDGVRRLRFEVDGFSYFLAVRYVGNGLCAEREAGEVCREAAGVCDAPERCDGESESCPPDEKLDASTTCRQSAGGCDIAESCDGQGDDCPPDELQEAGTVCRPTSEACDVPEACDGQSALCPEDTLAGSDVECRPAEGECDVAEFCTGDARACPDDMFAETDTACDDGLFCTVTSACDGRGSCVGSGDPCADLLGGSDADCSQSCVEQGDGFACTGNDPAGSYCEPSPCAEGECDGSGGCTETLQCPVFVDANTGSDGPTCGSSWANACASVQQGSNLARDATPPNPRVFVMSGTDYTHPARSSVLIMADGIAYYGGFTEASQQRPGDRTLASADYSVLDGQAAPAPVVVGANDTRLDGFVVTGGQAADGAGMFNDGVQNLTLANVEFTGNYAFGAGSASGRGGGLFNRDVDDLSITGARFFDNGAEGTFAFPGLGGALHNDTVTNLTIQDATFDSNRSVATNQARGGAIYSTATAPLRIQRTDFDGNWVDASGSGGLASGGAVEVSGGTTTLVDVRMLNNRAVGYGSAAGGAMHVDGDADLTRVRFEFNSIPLLDGGPSVARGGAYAVEATRTVQTTLTDVVFLYNTADASGSAAEGGGLYASHAVAGSTLAIGDSTFLENVARSARLGRGGGALVDGASTTLTGVQFVKNGVDGLSAAEGAGLFATDAPVEIRHSDFLRQVASGNANTGAGLYHGGADPLTVSNTGFVENAAESNTGGNAGGGVYIADGADYTLTNVSLVDNLPDALHTGSAAGTGALYNTALSGSVVGTAPSTEVATCTLTRGAYELSADFHAYLTATGVATCSNGDDTQADSAFGALDWRNLTTQLDGTLDTSPINAGRHYEPAGLRIRVFETGASQGTVRWEVQAPAGTQCELSDDNGTYALDSAEIPSGSATVVSLDTDTGLRCWVGGTVVASYLPR